MATFSFEDAQYTGSFSFEDAQIPETFSFEDGLDSPTRTLGGTVKDAALGNPLFRGFERLGYQIDTAGGLIRGDEDAVTQGILKSLQLSQKYPGSQARQELGKAWERGEGAIGGIKEALGEVGKDWNEAKGILGKVRALGENAIAMGSGVLEQTPNAVAPMTFGALGMAGGSVVGGPAGAVGGGFGGFTVGNATVEAMGIAQEMLQDAGINMDDEEAVSSFVRENRGEILKRAGIKGAIIGGVDTLTAGAGHLLLTAPGKAAANRALKAMGTDLADNAAVKAAMESAEFAERIASDAVYQASKKGLGNIARNTTVAVMDPAGEFTGEYVGSGVATGKWDTKDATLEALSSIGQSGGMFALQKGAERITSPESTSHLPSEKILGAESVDQVVAEFEADSISAEPEVTAQPTGALARAPELYRDMYQEAGLRYGVDPNLLAAQGWAESNFNPDAVSPAGAQGIAQFMPGTAAEYGIDPMNPAEAIDGQARYMARMLQRYNGDVSKALAAYNAGPGRVDDGSWQRITETQNYVGRILGEIGNSRPPMSDEWAQQERAAREYNQSRNVRNLSDEYVRGLTSEQLYADVPYRPNAGQGIPVNEHESALARQQEPTRAQRIAEAQANARRLYDEQDRATFTPAPGYAQTGTPVLPITGLGRPVTAEESVLARQSPEEYTPAQRRQARQEDIEQAFKHTVLPDKIEQRLAVVERQMDQGEVGSRWQLPDVYGDGGHVVESGRWDGMKSTNPDWLRDKESILHKAGKAGIRAVIKKARAGQQLTARQVEIWEEILRVAKIEHQNDPETGIYQAYQDIHEKEGLTGGGPKSQVYAGDLSPGDKVLVSDYRGPHVAEHRGYDAQGRAIIKNGVEIHADPWDAIEVEDVKRGPDRKAFPGRSNRMLEVGDADQVVAARQAAISERKSKEREQSPSWFHRAPATLAADTQGFVADQQGRGQWAGTAKPESTLRQEIRKIKERRAARKGLPGTATAERSADTGAFLQDQAGRKGYAGRNVVERGGDAEGFVRDQKGRGEWAGRQAAETKPKTLRERIEQRRAEKEASPPPAAQPSARKATPEKPETEQLVRWQNAVNAYVNGEDAANARTDTIDRALQNGLVKPGEVVAFAEWLIGQGGRPGLVDHARKVQGGTESTEDSHSDKVKDIENVVAQKRARVERTLAAMKKGTKAQKEAAGREYLFAKKELQGWEQVLEDVRAEQQPPTTPAQDRTPEKPAGVATSGQRQEQAAKEPWQMTREEYLADALERNEYRDQYKDNPKLLPPFEENTEREWRRSVEKAAETDRIPDAVLDSYLEKFGKQVFASTFRGIAEKGVQGYFYPEIREEQKAAPAYKKTAIYDLKPHERTWAQQRGEERKAMGRMLTKAEWKELREQHKAAVQKALWNGEKVPASVLADYPELANAKPRKDADMADVAETDFGNMAAPAWAEEHATAIGGRVVYHDEETALVEGYSLLTGKPIHAGVLKSSGSRTRVNIAKYTGKMFTDEQKQNLIKQSERVQAEEQRRHEENPDGPFAGKGRIAASEHIPEWVAETVREWTAMLGIKRRIYITTIEDAKRDAGKLHGPFGAIRSASLTNENQMGTHRQLSNGDSYLVLRPGGSKSLLFEVIGHELGHILEKEAWADAPKELKDAVERDFNAWRDRKGISGREWVDSMRAMRSARKTAVAAGVTSETMAPYWKSFSEYFADQTARWAMTSEKPRSVVERFFKRIADKLKRLYAAVAGQKFLPSESMRAYLDSRTEAAMAVRQVSVEVVAETDFGNIKEGEIYPTTVSGKKMYAIRGDNPRGGGDSLFGTREEAQAEIERAAKMKAANEKSRAEAKEDAKNKAEAEREAKRKAELAGKQTLWFDEEYIAGLSAMARGRLMKALDKRYNTRDGERTLREYIESGGFTGTDVSEVPTVQYDRAKYNRMDSREQAEYDKKLEKKKTEYRVTRDDDTSFQIPKIVFDAIRKDAAQPAQGEAEKSDVSPKSPNAPITDFGEKIGGARKDVWSKSLDDMRQVDDADVSAQPLSKVWPAPDYQKMLEEEGADKSTVALVRALRDSIPTKPRAGWKLQKWAEAVTAARGVAIGLLDGRIDTARARHAIQVVNASKLGEGILDQAELYSLVGHGKSLVGIQVSRGQYSLLNGVKYDPPKVIWSVEQRAKTTAFSNWPRQLSIGETRQEAIEKFVAKYSEMDINKPASKQVDFSIYSYRSGKEGFYVGKKVGRNYIDLAGPFDTAKEARKYKSENQEALVDKLAKVKKIPSERRDTNNPRVGEDMRGGQDVTPEMFRDAFGFRGVEFGNWVEQKKRQSDLNDAYDALMDMAAILEINPKAISLNGELALAFGARGSGGRSAGGNTPAAHYEPGKVVINLTKKRGAGSLGHEWWHALDNYFAKMRKGDGYLTEALDVSLVERGSVYEHKGEVRKEMVDAFGGVMKAIRSTAMKARASKLDNRRSAAYWTTKPEMSARAFESYLISKLHDQGASNDYLANIVDDQTWKAAESLGFELDDSYPYPTAGEMPKIRGAFDHFFQTVEQKETDKGVALYSKAGEGQVARANVLAEIGKAIGQLRARRLIRNGRVVILKSQAEAKRVVANAEIKYSKDGKIQGFYLDGKVYLVEDGIAEGQAMAVLMHELGEHAAQLGFANNLKYRAILKSLEKHQNEQSEIGEAIRAALQRVPAETTGKHKWSEVAAYLVENNADQGLSLVNRLVAFFKKWLYKAGAISADKLTHKDLAVFAYAAVRAEARRSGKVDNKANNIDNKPGFLASMAESLGVTPEQLQREYDAVVKRYQGTVRWLKAPNGKKSNLNERQWVLARTPRFKEWFGDWENDPDNASKVVDANGEPLVVYHGSPSPEFSEFNLDKSGSNLDSGWLGKGIYFTDTAATADYHSQTGRASRPGVYPVFLNIKNPFEWGKKTKGIRGLVMNGEQLPLDLTEKISEKTGFKFDQDAEPDWDAEKKLSRALTDELSSRGFDGVVASVRGQQEFVAFSPTQIKSATGNTGAFDASNPDIRYSVADNIDNQAVKYSKVDSKELEQQQENLDQDLQDVAEQAPKKFDIRAATPLIKTAEYTLSKIAAGRRALEAVSRRQERKFMLQAQILDGVTDGMNAAERQVAKDTGFTKTFQQLKKQAPRSYVKVQQYLLGVDRTGRGFYLSHNSGYVVTTPEGELVGLAKTKEAALTKARDHVRDNGLKGKVLIKDYGTDKGFIWTAHNPNKSKIGTFANEQEAVAAMIKGEREGLLKRGFTEQEAAAVQSFREMTNRAFDQHVEGAREVLRRCEEEGIDPPMVEGIDETRRWAVRGKSGKNIATFESREKAEDMIRQLLVTHPRYANADIVRQTDNEIKKMYSLHDAIAQMGDMRGTYFPRQRKHGGMGLRAINEQTGEKIFLKGDLYIANLDPEAKQGVLAQKADALRRLFNSGTPLGLEARKLRRQGFVISFERDTTMPEDVFSAKQLSTNIAALMDEAMQRVDKSSMTPAEVAAYVSMHRAVTDQLAGIIKQRGFLSSRMKRSENYWQGFEEDPLKAGTAYATGLAGGIAKRQLAQDLTMIIAGRDITWKQWKEDNPSGDWPEYTEFVNERKIDPIKQKNIYGETMSWAQEVLRNQEAADRIIGTLKGLAVLKYLAFRIPSALVNLSNMALGVPATISSHTGLSIARSSAQINRSLKTLVDYKRGTASALDAQILTEISDRGWDNPQFNHDAAAVLRGRWGNAWQGFVDAGMWLFGQAEVINRRATIHAAYKMWQRANPELTHEELMQKAHHASDRAHGWYGQETAPKWTRGAANPLKAVWTFQKFGQNYLLNIGEMLGKGDHKQAAYMLLAPVILGGPKATLITPLLAAMAKGLGIGGEDPEEELYAWARDTFGSDSWMRFGAPGLLGISFQGSLAMGIPVVSDVLAKGKRLNSLAELFGAPGSVVYDAYSAGKHALKGEYLKAAEKALPSAFGSVAKAIRESTEGVTTESYGSVYYGTDPLKVSGVEAYLRGLSFSTADIAGKRQQQWSERKVKDKYTEQRADINREIKRLYLQYDYNPPDMEWAGILVKIDKYNDKVIGLNRPDITPITGKSIRAVLKRNARASKFERMRAMEMYEEAGE